MNALSHLFRLAVIAVAVISTCISATAQSASGCAARISNVVAQKFPGFNIISREDLDGDLQDYLRETKYAAEPGCLRGDFNADGLIDYVVLIRRNDTATKDEKLVVLKGVEAAQFETVTLDTFTERRGSFYVVPVLNSSKAPKAAEKLRGFKLILFESASRLYYWNGKTFATKQLSD